MTRMLCYEPERGLSIQQIIRRRASCRLFLSNTFKVDTVSGFQSVLFMLVVARWNWEVNRLI